MDKTQSVKINMKVVQKVGRLKKKTGVAVGKYFEIAALEKMERDILAAAFSPTKPIINHQPPQQAK